MLRDNELRVFGGRGFQSRAAFTENTLLPKDVQKHRMEKTDE